MICPICKSEMEVQRFIIEVRDGNTVWQCPTDKDHRFFKNMKDVGLLHQNPDASNMLGAKPIRTWEYEVVKTINFKEITEQ